MAGSLPFSEKTVPCTIPIVNGIFKVGEGFGGIFCEKGSDGDIQTDRSFIIEDQREKGYW